MYVFENRVATIDQLHRKFFPHTNKESAASRNRIRMLYRSGYLKPCVTMVDQQVYRYYEVTEQAFHLIKERWRIEIDKPKFRSESPYHDIRLNELRSVFERLKLFEKYYPENMLQSSSVLQDELRTREAVQMQSDGVLLLKDTESTEFNFAIELETSKKAPERYKSKLWNYYRSSSQLDGVLYICSDQQIINAIVKADQVEREDQKSILHYALEKDVLKSDGQIIFTNAKEGLIGLY
jgi:hypothetical protein